MALKEKVADASGIPVDRIPGKWQMIGDIALAKFVKERTLEEKKKIARAVMDILPRVRTVCEIKHIEGDLRKPRVKVLATVAGKKRRTETIHKEAGISFKLDVAKVMFSKGNAYERSRLALHVKPEEKIVDMFAGIGYFSLAIAMRQPSAKVYAVEKSPVAFRYLKENVALNKLQNVIPKKGDCRRVRIKEKADRVLMGYFPGTESYLPTAFRFLGRQGVIHYHNIYSEKDVWSKPLEELEAAGKKAGYRISSIIGHRKVKSYAPRTFHVVVDAGFEKVVV